MPCMCGDTCCPSCGPAQGNWRCPICNVWASEGCIHINARSGRIKLRFQGVVKANAKAEHEAEAKMPAWDEDKANARPN